MNYMQLVGKLEAYPQIFIAISMALSFLATYLVKYIYDNKYISDKGGSNIGTAILLIGPAVTGLMIAIQSSLPLSLGLLGALSFVRFRNPVKDPEEIAYLLIVIATSVAVAVKAYALTGLIIFVSYCSAYYIKKTRSYLTTSKTLSLISEKVSVSLIDSTISGKFEMRIISISNNTLVYEILKDINLTDLVDFIESNFDGDIEYRIF